MSIIFLFAHLPGLCSKSPFSMVCMIQVATPLMLIQAVWHHWSQTCCARYSLNRAQASGAIQGVPKTAQRSSACLPYLSWLIDGAHWRSPSWDPLLTASQRAGSYHHPWVAKDLFPLQPKTPRAWGVHMKAKTSAKRVHLHNMLVAKIAKAIGPGIAAWCGLGSCLFQAKPKPQAPCSIRLFASFQQLIAFSVSEYFP